MSSAVTSITPAVATAQPTQRHRSYRRDGLSILRRHSAFGPTSPKTIDHRHPRSVSSSPLISSISRKSSQGTSRNHNIRAGGSTIGSIDRSVYLSKEDVEESLSSYKGLLQSASKFQEQLKALSLSASEFAHDLESFARGKGIGDSASGLQSSSGLHYVMATHFGLMAESVKQLIEQPLEKNLDDYEFKLENEEIERQKTLAYISHKIKVTEARSLSAAKHGTRDLNQFRQALNELSSQVDELEDVNEDYYTTIHEWQQENGGLVLDQMSKLVRVEADILDRISSKCLEDNHLQEMIQDGPEPFSIYERVDSTEAPKDFFTTLPATSLFEQPEQGALSKGKPPLVQIKSSVSLGSDAAICSSASKTSNSNVYSPTTNPQSCHSSQSPITPQLPNIDLHTEPDHHEHASLPLLNPSLLYTWVGEFNPGASIEKNPKKPNSHSSQSRKPDIPSIHLYDLTPPSSQKSLNIS